jgi:hypothetical protein
MNRSARKTRTLVVAFASVAWLGVLLQFYLSLQLAVANGNTIAGGIVAFLGYFTVLTNILVCVALTLPLTVPRSALGQFFLRPTAVAGAATSISLVGVAYHLLLRNAWAPEGLQWGADVLLHYAVPVLYVLYWWLAAPKASLRWTDPLTWCAYPAAYFAYVLARGAIIGSYPYPFIDVATIGYQQTLLNAVGLLIAYIALGLLFVVVGRASSSTAK